MSLKFSLLQKYSNYNEKKQQHPNNFCVNWAKSWPKSIESIKEQHVIKPSVQAHLRTIKCDIGHVVELI